MTAQEIITRVWLHLNAQGAQCTHPSDGGCMYRGPNGTSCAVGCLLDDETAEKLDENAIIPGECEWDSVAPKWTLQHIDLLANLQNAHDSLPEKGDWLPWWREKMRHIATTYNATLTAVTE